MKPYVKYVLIVTERSLQCSLVGVLCTCLCFASPLRGSDDSHPEVTSIADAAHNPLFKSGDEHYYNLEYDQALQDYEKDEREHPTDVFAINEVLKTVVFRELYRLNLLDTTLYAHDGFLNKTAPEAADPKVRARIDALFARALLLEDNRLKQNLDDVDALYCRGVTHGLKSTYTALVDKSFVSALRNAVNARHDHERVLELDSNYIDAKTVVGAHLYIVGSLPLPLKMLAGVTGLNGSKKKGLQYLDEVGTSKAGTSVDARVALALFLRREARYPEALKIVRTLEAEHPRNFLFALEAANLLKDEGDGPAATTAYRRLLQHGTSFSSAHLELAAFGLGEVLRGQRDFIGAQNAYDLIADMQSVQPQLKVRALLAAGEMYDQTGNRVMAMKRYNQVVWSEGAGKYADVAEKHRRHPPDFTAQRGLVEQDF